MRTTLRIDDDLLRDLKRRATAEKVTLGEIVNRLLRSGVAAPLRKAKPFKQAVHSMGPPRTNLDKALALAAAEEDEEILRKLAARK